MANNTIKTKRIFNTPSSTTGAVSGGAREYFYAVATAGQTVFDASSVLLPSGTSMKQVVVTLDETNEVTSGVTRVDSIFTFSSGLPGGTIVVIKPV